MSFSNLRQGFKRKSLWLSLIGIMLLIILSVFTIKADAAGNKGWVEAHVIVPRGFDQNVIIGIQNVDTYEDYAARVIDANGYIERFQVPEGDYIFTNAFLENGDYRYNTVLVGGDIEFHVSGNDDAPAVLLEFKTSFNEAYSSGANIGTASGSSNDVHIEMPVSEPASGNGEASSEATTGFIIHDTEDPEASIQDETSDVPSDSSKGSEETQNTDATVSEDQDDEEPKDLTGWHTILYGFLAMAIFVGIVFLGAYLYRRHIELN